MQTKEHIWSGVCEGTREVVGGLQAQLQGVCDNKAWGYVMGKIWPMIMGDMAKIKTDVHNLDAHGYSGILIGIWSNRLFDRVREKLVQEGMESVMAQQCVEDLVMAHIRYAMKVMRVWNNVVK